MANEKTSPLAIFIAVIVAVLLTGLGLFVFISTETGTYSSTYKSSSSDVDLRGTYHWYYRGISQKVIISTTGNRGPCTFIGMSGTEYKESFSYYVHVSDRPQLSISGTALIDVRNKMVYFSDSDFDAYRNGVPCSISY